MSRTLLLATGVLIGLLCSNLAYANPRIAVLAFELNDITSLPNTPQEQQRTASIQPLLEAAIKQTQTAYELVAIDPKSQAAANPSLGYLFHFHDLAAKLGQDVNADWVIVGQHSKPSFLFSYLLVHVINVKTQQLVGSIDIELKGNHESVTQHGVRNLARKIGGIIGGNSDKRE
ncbi:hypothetical protein JCM14076_13950 [Methylosoma difficile]